MTDRTSWTVVSATQGVCRRKPYPLRALKATVLVGLVGLAALAEVRAAPEGRWSGFTRAGVDALRRGSYAKAKRMFRAAVAEAEQFPAPDSRLVDSLTGLAKTHSALHEYREAESALARALVIEEQLVWPKHPTLAAMLDSYVLLLRHLGRDSDATAVEARIRLILSDPVLETPSTTWAKREADQGEFDRDRQACLKEAWYGASAYGSLVDPKLYSECLEQRGWRPIAASP